MADWLELEDVDVLGVGDLAGDLADASGRPAVLLA